MLNNHKAETAVTFIMGAAVGAMAAFLLAWKSGKNLREDISESVVDGVKQARRTGKELKQRAHKVVDLVQDQVQDAMRAGQDAYSDAKKA